MTDEQRHRPARPPGGDRGLKGTRPMGAPIWARDEDWVKRVPLLLRLIALRPTPVRGHRNGTAPDGGVLAGVQPPGGDGLRCARSSASPLADQARRGPALYTPAHDLVFTGPGKDIFGKVGFARAPRTPSAHSRRVPPRWCSPATGMRCGPPPTWPRSTLVATGYVRPHSSRRADRAYRDDRRAGDAVVHQPWRHWPSCSPGQTDPRRFRPFIFGFRSA